MGKPTYFNAVQILTDNKATHGHTDGPISKIHLADGTTPPSESAINAKLSELQAEYDAQAYARKRQAEYPSIQDLVVALYDTDDKTAIETKRAEVKAKYPKPE